MEFELYCIYDVSEQRYGIPMAQTNDATAMRGFAHEAMKPDSIWNSHPQDFILYKVGVFNSGTGEITAYPAPERICSATDFVRKEK